MTDTTPIPVLLGVAIFLWCGYLVLVAWQVRTERKKDQS